jgi:hypothetical protein
MRDYLQKLAYSLPHLPEDVRQSIFSCQCVACIHDVLSRYKGRTTRTNQHKHVFISKNTNLMKKHELLSQLIRFIIF